MIYKMFFFMGTKKMWTFCPHNVGFTRSIHTHTLQRPNIQHPEVLMIYAK